LHDGRLGVLGPWLDLLEGGTIALVSQREGIKAAFRSWASRLDREAAFPLTIPSLLRQLARGEPAPAAVVVDLHRCQPLAAAVEQLIAFRLTSPTVPVVLVMDDLRRHDFGTERLAMCDVSLRGPIDMALLELALCEAIANNNAWLERLFEQCSHEAQATADRAEVRVDLAAPEPVARPRVLHLVRSNRAAAARKLEYPND
jgi:hypothetical protein